MRIILRDLTGQLDTIDQEDRQFGSRLDHRLQKIVLNGLTFMSRRGGGFCCFDQVRAYLLDELRPCDQGFRNRNAYDGVRLHAERNLPLICWVVAVVM